MAEPYDDVEVSRLGTSGLEIPRPRATMGARRGWRGWCVTVSAAPDVLYPYDPAVLRAIHREFDPDVVALIVRRVYRSTTGGFRVARFHAFGRRHTNPEFVPPPWTAKVMMPLMGRQPAPTAMMFHLEDRTTRLGDGLPGSYLPFNWRAYKAVRALYQTLTTKQKQKHEAEHGRAAQARKRRLEADAMVRERQQKDAKWLDERMQNILNDEHIANRLVAQQMDARKTPMAGPWEGAR